MTCQWLHMRRYYAPDLSRLGQYNTMVGRTSSHHQLFASC